MSYLPVCGVIFSYLDRSRALCNEHGTVLLSSDDMYLTVHTPHLRTTDTQRCTCTGLAFNVRGGEQIKAPIVSLISSSFWTGLGTYTSPLSVVSVEFHRLFDRLNTYRVSIEKPLAILASCASSKL